MDHVSLLRVFELGLCAGAGWALGTALVGAALGVLQGLRARPAKD
jgi:hypothetical protein